MDHENPMYIYIYISRAVFPIVNLLSCETQKSTASEESVILCYFYSIISWLGMDVLLLKG